MYFFGRSSRAKRAAIATISPLVEQSRLHIGRIPDHFWRQPYTIGFLSTLITLIALRNANGRMGTDQIGLAQLEAWIAITGYQDDQIGEDIQLLSAQADPDFLCGCQNAALFEQTLNNEQQSHAPDTYQDPNNEDVFSSPHNGAEFSDFGTATFQHHSLASQRDKLSSALWSEFFDDHIRT